MKLSIQPSHAIKKCLLPITLVSLISAGPAMAGPFGGHAGMGSPLEKMVDHLDLTDYQETQIDAIIARIEGEGMSKKDKHKKRYGMMKNMLMNNPDAPDFMQKAEEHANQVAEQVKQRILKTSQARKEIYDLLTEEQKQQIDKKLQRKMKKMEKRMAKSDY